MGEGDILYSSFMNRPEFFLTLKDRVSSQSGDSL